MFDLKNLNTKKKPNFDLSFGKRPKVKQLDAYYLQGGKWHKVSTLNKGGANGDRKTVR